MDFSMSGVLGQSLSMEISVAARNKKARQGAMAQAYVVPGSFGIHVWAPGPQIPSLPFRDFSFGPSPAKFPWWPFVGSLCLLVLYKIQTATCSCFGHTLLRWTPVAALTSFCCSGPCHAHVGINIEHRRRHKGPIGTHKGLIGTPRAPGSLFEARGPF